MLDGRYHFTWNGSPYDEDRLFRSPEIWHAGDREVALRRCRAIS